MENGRKSGREADMWRLQIPDNNGWQLRCAVTQLPIFQFQIRGEWTGELLVPLGAAKVGIENVMEMVESISGDGGRIEANRDE